MSSYYILQKSKQQNDKATISFAWGYTRFIYNRQHVYSPTTFDQCGQLIDPLDTLYVSRSFVDNLLTYCKKAKIPVKRDVEQGIRVPASDTTLNLYTYTIDLEEQEAILFKLQFAESIAVAK